MKKTKAKKPVFLSGTVVSGLGKGRYFMRQEGYRKQFIKKLGMDPYHGTLDLKISGENECVLDSIKRSRGIIISGFKEGNKEFGGARCYSAKISGIRCAIVVPKLSTHKYIAEIISSQRLRTVLGLKDGSRVRASVFE